MGGMNIPMDMRVLATTISMIKKVQKSEIPFEKPSSLTDHKGRCQDSMGISSLLAGLSWTSGQTGPDLFPGLLEHTLMEPPSWMACSGL